MNEIYISHYTTDEIDDIGEIDVHRSAVRLNHPGTSAPRAAQASTRSRPALAHMSTAMVVRIVVFEALHPRHAHTRLWRPRVRNQAMERRGADTHGAQ